MRFHVVDPMHNLFLGIAKHTTETWQTLSILRPSDFSQLQSSWTLWYPHLKIGRMPRKIGSGFGSITADDMVELDSVFALKGILPEIHYSCWLTFVNACSILCQFVVTRGDIENAHELLIKFRKEFERLCGKEYCTPNLHMMCHICESMFDYGPLSAFWAFTFEHYNGAFGEYKVIMVWS